MEQSHFLWQLFPKGLKILLVGIDKLTQTLIETQLSQPFYLITTCDTIDSALSCLGDRNYSFDLVISDVEHRDGYQFVRDQRLKTNIPHVLIRGLGRSSDDEMQKAFEFGACYVLSKPVSKSELNNVWQHIRWSQGQRIRKQQQQTIIETEHPPKRDETHVHDPDKDPKVENVVGEFMNYVGASSLRKRRRRIVWSTTLHQAFVDVVDKLGGPEKAVPKAILENMKVPFLKRENVASHLQKYRIFLKKKQVKPVDRIASSSNPGIFDKSNENNEVSVPHLTQQFTDSQLHHFQHVRQPLMQMKKQPEQNFNCGPVIPLSMVPSSSLPRHSCNIMMQQQKHQQKLVSATWQVDQNIASVSCYLPTIKGGNDRIITPEASDPHMILNSCFDESNCDFIGSEYSIHPYLDLLGFGRFENNEWKTNIGDEKQQYNLTSSQHIW